MKAKIPPSLVQEIRRNISLRVLLCIILLFLTLTLTLFYHYQFIINRLRDNLLQVEQELTSYIISQELIGNRYAIKIKFRELEERNKFIIERYKSGKVQEYGLQTKNLLTWTYFAKIQCVDGRNFGFYTISGTLLNDSYFLNSLYIEITLTFVFLLLVIFILYPIGTYIPHNIIVKPIIDLLSLLEQRAPDSKILITGPKEIRDLQNNIITMLKKEKDFAKKENTFKLAKQVAHDIRSPLVALETTIKSLHDLPEQKKMLINYALSQIRNITNNLLQKHVSHKLTTHSQVEPVLLVNMLNYVVSEKTAEIKVNKNIKISLKLDDDSLSAFVKVIPSEFKRVVSNVCNNSIAALTKTKNGEITIKINSHSDKNYHSISITDNGHGIEEQKIHTVFEEGVSYKKSGNGLGLFYARNSVNRWGGNIFITSEINKGTIVTINLPKQPIPKWIALELVVEKNNILVILDDNKCIFEQWKMKMEEIEMTSTTLIYHNTPNSFFNWFHSISDHNKSYIFLIDYDLFVTETCGLDIIEKIHLNNTCYLVTSYSEDPKIQKKCDMLNVKIIPKCFIPILPIREK